MLSKSVLDHITQKVDRSFTGEKRKNFLQALREKPEYVERWVQQNLLEWTTLACFDLAEVVIVYGFDKDSKEMVEHFKKHFKKEMGVPNPVPA